jgi:hypothetical protein
MSEHLNTSIEPIPFDAGLGPDAAVLIITAEEDAGTGDLYRRFSGSPYGCRAGKRAVAIASTSVLNSPDLVTAVGRRSSGSEFELDIEICRFEGTIRGNDPWIALVRLELGFLKAGAYYLLVRETVFSFKDPQHPEQKTNRTSSEQRIQFDCG